MTLKDVGLFAPVVLSCVAGMLALGIRCSGTDPANAMAGFWMFHAHCREVATAASTSNSLPEKSTPLAAEFRRSAQGFK